MKNYSEIYALTPAFTEAALMLDGDGLMQQCVSSLPQAAGDGVSNRTLSDVEGDNILPLPREDGQSLTISSNPSTISSSNIETKI